MSELGAFRDHCRRMAEAEHRPECASLRPEPYWVAWALSPDGMTMYWRGPKPPWSPAACDCHLTDAERALFARLADEIDAHLSNDDEPLWGEQ